ncbi:ATP-dependent translocase ABCB1-like [Bufo bufo]|uniref:ATP-dependent translocase ABCB1-like n=1 Tax=Bufo bufo TaxID=8384 RepID=UPI001ABDC8CF|nr:ATP-dependent translocase ABCB1-like [Bufo bufo]
MGQNQTAASKTGKATDDDSSYGLQYYRKRIMNEDSESKDTKVSHAKMITKETVGLLELFQYADKWDIILMVIGIVCAIGSGSAAPLNTVIFGQVAGILSTSENSINASSNNSGCASSTDFKAHVASFSYKYLVLGSIALVLSVIQIWTFNVSGTRQIMRIRQKFFNAILHQDMAWFDSYQIGTLNSRLTEDMNTIYEGLSINVCIFGQFLSTVVTGITIGFVKGWKLTLVTLAAGLLLFTLLSLWTKS